MGNKELLEEIRMNRKAIEEVRAELNLFKGKAFGFISVISFCAVFVIDLIKKKL